MDVVSVIIPVYNIEKWVGNCLGSVCGQTYEQLQIIIINDGSTDSSAIICEQFAKKDNRICLIGQENQGLSVARNKAMEYVAGKYVVFVDGDDWIDSAMIEKLYKACEQENTKMALCEYRNVFENGHLEKDHHTFSQRLCRRSASEILECMLCPNRQARIKSSVWAKMYQWDLIESYSFPIGRYYEDNVFTARAIYESGNCAYLDEALYYYQKGREGSILWKDELSRLIIDEIDMEKERLVYFLDHQEKELAGYANKQMLHHMLAYYGRMMQEPETYQKWMQEFRKILLNTEFPYHFDLVTTELLLFRIAPVITEKLLKSSYQIVQKKRKAEYARKGYSSVEIRKD